MKSRSLRYLTFAVLVSFLPSCSNYQMSSIQPGTVGTDAGSLTRPAAPPVAAAQQMDRAG